MYLFKEDLGWFSVLMLIGVLFLPTTNWLHKLIIKCRLFYCWTAVFFMMSALKKTAVHAAVETSAFEEFVKPIRAVGRKRTPINVLSFTVNNKQYQIAITIHLPL